MQRPACTMQRPASPVTTPRGSRMTSGHITWEHATQKRSYPGLQPSLPHLESGFLYPALAALFWEMPAQAQLPAGLQADATQAPDSS